MSGDNGVYKSNLIYYVKEQELRFDQRHLRADDFIEKLIAILVKFSQ